MYLDKSLYILRTRSAAVIYNETRMLRTYLGARIIQRESLEPRVLYELAREVTFGTLKSRAARRNRQRLRSRSSVAKFLYQCIDRLRVALLKSRREAS